ncbi:MAG: EamA family transporter [Candidatus Cyclobacteriaceae bacterium M3_2C_046]
MWVILGIVSSVFLGIYDIFKKLSLKDNAVLPVLFFATLSGTMVFVPLILISRTTTQFAAEQSWFIPSVDGAGHAHFFIKSMIVASSWIFAYFGLKHLPITIVTPIRASAPVWVLLGALLIFGEVLTLLQWAGLITTLLFYYLFSLAGKKEGIHFRKNKWVFFILMATLLGSVSALYDKYLTAIYDRLALQAYFSIYLVVVLMPVLLIFWFPRRDKYPFHWHFAIPLIGLCLIAADFLYFYALSLEDSLISILSILRRGSVITSFFVGAAVFKSDEKNIRSKAYILAGIFIGIILIVLGTEIAHWPDRLIPASLK